VSTLLNEKQQLFSDYYIETLNATQSAIKAGYSKKTAYSQGQRLLKHVEIRDYIDGIMAKKDSKRIASQNEILEILTKIIRGEETEELYTMSGDKINKKPKISDRLKAIELLGKRYNLFDKDNTETIPSVVIIDDISKENEVLEI
jgi:phage terminase small subunit